MQAAIKSKYGIAASLKEGVGGIFDVAIDGKLAYSNRTTYRFPTNEEIFEKIDAARKT